MADNLQYKGIRSTRLQIAVLLSLAVSSGYLWGDVNAGQWLDFLKWIFGTYALSEVGAKGASAYKERP